MKKVAAHLKCGSALQMLQHVLVPQHRSSLTGCKEEMAEQSCWLAALLLRDALVLLPPWQASGKMSGLYWQGLLDQQDSWTSSLYVITVA